MPLEIEVSIPVTATSRKQGSAGEEGQWGIITREGKPVLRDTAPSGAFGTLEKQAGTRVELLILNVQTRVAKLILPDATQLTPTIESAIRTSGLRFDPTKVKVTTARASDSSTMENDA
jgi:hypothetical protein